MSAEVLKKIALQVRNWGKWGPDDELGTLNYITPARIAAACRLATSGKVSGHPRGGNADQPLRPEVTGPTGGGHR